MVTTDATAMADWEECLRLSNGVVELVCTTQVGPRVLRIGFEGDRNLCRVGDAAGTRPDDGEWHLFGGHRLWHAPERSGRTDRPDNDPVEVTEHDDAVTFTQPTEPETGIRKELTVRLVDDEPRVRVTHTLGNEGSWPVEVAPWAITAVDPGGTAVLPLAARGGDRTADRTLTLWPYTDLGDDRFTFTDEAAFVEARRGGEETKLGVDGADGWVAYVHEGQALRKEFERDPSARYADNGAAVQVYANGELLELETLGPIERVDPGRSTTHVEQWTLFERVDLDLDDPAGAVRWLGP